MLRLCKIYIKDSGNNNSYNAKIIRKNKIRLRIFGNHNNIILADNFQVGPSKITVYGDHNLILLGDNNNKKAKSKLDFSLCGNNNQVQVEDGVNFGSAMEIVIGFKDYQSTNNAKVSISRDSSFGKTDMLLLEHNSEIKIGHNALFSQNVTLRLSDTHSVLDLDGKLLNYGKSIEIGDYVWVGIDVKFGKNTKIADHSIVGWGSVVTKKFEQPNVIIAGNPAKIVKENISWCGTSPENYLIESKKS